MAKELVISAPAHERRVAILEEGQLVEIYIEREKEFALVGSIYKGRVTRVLPGMQSAFVDIGLDGDAFLYVSDVFENLEEYEPAGAHIEPSLGVAEPQGTAPESALTEGEHGAVEEHGVESEHPEYEKPASFGEGPHAEGVAGAQPEENAGNVEAPPRQTFQPRNDADRGRGQGYRGNDRGGRGRWGRRGGRRQGGYRHDHGRNLPPSKYASPQGQDQRGYDQRRPDQRGPEATRHAGPAENEEPVLLPGESLAKYRGRTPATMLPPDDTQAQVGPGEARAEGAEASPHAGEAAGTAQRSYTGLPSWVLADTGASTESAAAAAETAHEAGPRAEAAPLRAEGDLSDEEVAALAAQLTEAKHEETHAEATADAVAGGADFEDEGEDADETPDEPTSKETIEEEEEEETELAEDEASEEAAGEAAGEHSEANGEAVEVGEAEVLSPAPTETPVTESDEHLLLPGETRAPHDASRQDSYRDARPRDSARIGDNPRSRFQRPYTGPGRDRGRYGRRGGRPQRFERRTPGGHHYSAPRRPQLISEMLKTGQDVVVQIAKEPLGKKGARITSHVALPGRFLVYMPTIDHIGVSRRIAAAENRSRLRRLVGEARGSYPGGFIVRTAAGGADDDEIRTDIEFLGKTWNEIKKKSEERKAPALLHRDLNLVERILRDYVNEDYTAIWTDSEEEYGKIVEFMGRFQPKLVNRVKLYTKETPIFEEFGIQHELDKALRPKVWLKSGGYIVINHTEALVAIDVNTGKYVGKGSTRLEDTIVKTNLEAVKEIVRQIRLRDLGGIIVVDFIDMEERRNREKVMAALQLALEQDKAPSKALSFNEFGLVAITRKRTKQALERVLCQPCPYCSGSGMVKSIPTLCYEIQAEARKMAVEQDQPNITLRVHPEIAKALKTRESMLIDELEQNTHKHVIIQSDATLHWEQYDIY